MEIIKLKNRIENLKNPSPWEILDIWEEIDKLSLKNLLELKRHLSNIGKNNLNLIIK